MEQKANEKTMKKALYLLIGIPLIVVLIMFGILIYNNYLHEKELEEIRKDRVDINDILNREDNESENENKEDLDLTGYTEIDISEQNIFPIYEKYEQNSFIFNLPNNLSYEGKFVIENNKLFFIINEKSYLININNPKKVVIGDYGMDNTYTLMVLTESGEIYTVYLNPNYDENDNTLNANQVINNFIIEANKNIKKYYDFSGIDNISAVLLNYNSEYKYDWAWENLYITYVKNNKEMAIHSISMYNLDTYPAKDINDLTLNLGPMSVKNDGTVYVDDKKADIKVKYSFYYEPDVGFGVVLDEDNYLYVNSIGEYKKGKVVKVYKNNNNTYVVKFEDGTFKHISSYYDELF